MLLLLFDSKAINSSFPAEFTMADSDLHPAVSAWIHAQKAQYLQSL